MKTFSTLITLAILFVFAQWLIPTSELYVIGIAMIAFGVLETYRKNYDISYLFEVGIMIIFMIYAQMQFGIFNGFIEYVRQLIELNFF